MKRRLAGNWIVVLAIGTAFVVWWRSQPVDEIVKPPPPDSAVGVIEFLGDDEAHGFERAVVPREMKFPADHGPHNRFRTEWWYFTGNLETTDKRHFGYQFTVFRRALGKDERELKSDWEPRQIYMAHIGLTDVADDQFHESFKLSRDSLKLAGATAVPFKVWLEDWTVDGNEQDCEGCTQLHIQAQAEDFSLNLNLSSLKPVVKHGDNGLSRKGVTPGNASYYYSLTRLQTDGSLSVNGTTYQVSGTSWMDHEWFTSVLGAQEVGWDWFSVQLDDAREIMFFQLRNNTADSVTSDGTFIDQNGVAYRLTGEDVRLKQLTSWRSEASGSTYPIEWAMELPELGINLNIAAVMEEQERLNPQRYWEGSVRVTGTDGAHKVSGVGYLEMTGY